MDGIQPYMTLDMGGFIATELSNVVDYLAYNLVIDFDDGTNTMTGSTQPTANMGTIS